MEVERVVSDLLESVAVQTDPKVFRYQIGSGEVGMHRLSCLDIIGAEGSNGIVVL